ncbi:MAG: serine--tRNA ligase, partial [Chlamydiales bacterium]
MLDIKRIRAEKKSIEAKVQEKEPGLTLDIVLELDERIRALKTETEDLQNRRNSHSKEIGELRRKKEYADALMQEVREMGETISANEHLLASLEQKFSDALSRIPNIAMDDVKISQDKEENVIYKVVGEKPTFPFTPKNHLELNEKLRLFEFTKTAKTSGAGWPAYRGVGAQLEWALLSYMIEIQIMRGFEFWLPPLAVRPPTMFGSGQMPKFAGQFYEVPDKQDP